MKHDITNQKTNQNAARGFTLIELLVVIAIIAILAGMLLPVLAKVKSKATQASCLVNQKQLGLAVNMYSDEFSGFLPGANFYTVVNGVSTTYGTGMGGMAPVPSAWNSPGWASADQAAALKSVEEAEQNGILYPYVKNVRSFHCPSDLRYNRQVTDASPNCWAYDSYSKCDWVGKPGQLVGATPTHGIDKIANVPEAATAVLMVEEWDGRGVNENTWEYKGADHGVCWVDVFAAPHNMASTFVYIDGHAVAHKWLESTTVDAITKWKANHAPATPVDRDYNWFQPTWRTQEFPQYEW